MQTVFYGVVHACVMTQPGSDTPTLLVSTVNIQVES